jgi:hypothetical protein
MLSHLHAGVNLESECSTPSSGAENVFTDQIMKYQPHTVALHLMCLACPEEFESIHWVWKYCLQKYITGNTSWPWRKQTQDVAKRGYARKEGINAVLEVC